jgi:hypothetical protein
VSDHLFVAVPFAAYLVAVVATGPLVGLAFALNRFGGVRPFRRALLAVAAVPLVGLVGLAVWLGVEVAPLAALDVPARVLPVWLACWGPPFALAYVLGRRFGHPPERALRRASAPLPVGLLASLAVFVAPGGALRYNITFLEGTEALLWWTAFGLVLLATPAALVAASAAVERRS